MTSRHSKLAGFEVHCHDEATPAVIDVGCCRHEWEHAPRTRFGRGSVFTGIRRTHSAPPWTDKLFVQLHGRNEV